MEPATASKMVDELENTIFSLETLPERGAIFDNETGGDHSMAKQIWKPGNMLYPLPVIMVSCGTAERTNIITLAWAGTICSDPAMVSISVRKERFSHGIIEESGEFVINLVTGDLVYACDYCGVKSGREVDKFAEMKLTPQLLAGTKTPAIAESPVNLVCKVTEKKELGSHDCFLATVTHVAVDDAYMNSAGKFELNSTGLVTYSHGEYFLLGEKLGKFGYSVEKKKR